MNKRTIREAETELEVQQAVEKEYLNSETALRNEIVNRFVQEDDVFAGGFE